MSLINVSNIYCDTKCLQNKDIKELFDNYEFVKQQLQDEVNSSKNYYNISTTNSNSNTGALIMNSEKNKNIVNTFDISIENIQNKIDVYKNNIDNSNKDVELYNLYYEKFAENKNIIIPKTIDTLCTKKLCLQCNVAEFLLKNSR